MSIFQKTYAAASCSWINPSTGLPENDHPIVQDSQPRAFLTGNHGFRFCNFVEIWVKMDSRGTVMARGWSPASGIYRAPSFLRISSHAFDLKRDITIRPEGLCFTQIAGARTVTAEIGGAVGGAVVGGIAGGALTRLPAGVAAGAAAGAIIGEYVEHQGLVPSLGFLPPMGNFPPIWSKITITLKKDGRFDAKLVQHSLFPSLTFYVQSTPATETKATTFRKVSVYSAGKDRELGQWQNRGWGAYAPASGPSGGNPWGVSKGILGQNESVPN